MVTVASGPLPASGRAPRDPCWRSASMSFGVMQSCAGRGASSPNLLFADHPLRAIYPRSIWRGMTATIQFRRSGEMLPKC